MYSHTPLLPGNVDIELPLADARKVWDIALTLATLAGRVGAVGSPFEPAMSQVAATPRRSGLRAQDFVVRGS